MLLLSDALASHIDHTLWIQPAQALLYSPSAGSGLAKSLGYTKERGNKVAFHSEAVGVSMGTGQEHFQPQLALMVINRMHHLALTCELFLSFSYESNSLNRV